MFFIAWRSLNLYDHVSPNALCIAVEPACTKNKDESRRHSFEKEEFLIFWETRVRFYFLHLFCVPVAVGTYKQYHLVAVKRSGRKSYHMVSHIRICCFYILDKFFPGIPE